MTKTLHRQLLYCHFQFEVRIVRFQPWLIWRHSWLLRLWFNSTAWAACGVSVYSIIGLFPSCHKQPAIWFNAARNEDLHNAGHRESSWLPCWGVGGVQAIARLLLLDHIPCAIFKPCISSCESITSVKIVWILTFRLITPVVLKSFHAPSIHQILMSFASITKQFFWGQFNFSCAPHLMYQSFCTAALALCPLVWTTEFRPSWTV